MTDERDAGREAIENAIKVGANDALDDPRFSMGPSGLTIRNGGRPAAISAFWSFRSGVRDP
jgi:hypothetical protein